MKVVKSRYQPLRSSPLFTSFIPQDSINSPQWGGKSTLVCAPVKGLITLTGSMGLLNCSILRES